MFKIGDTVIILADKATTEKNTVGVICEYNHDEKIVGVNFSPLTSRHFHSCEGHCPEESGWYYELTNIKLYAPKNYDDIIIPIF
jgi:hypothetical protein